MKKQLIKSAALSLAVVGLSVASYTTSVMAQIDRSQKPAAGPVPKSAFPPFTEAVLKNGLHVVIVEDHKQPVVYFRTMVMSGNSADGKQTGAAQAVASMLEKGTKNLSADQIAQKLDFFGASVGAAANLDDINVFVSTLKQHMNEVLPIYADLIKNPTFPQEELDKYQAQTISQLKVSKKSSSDPGRMLGRRIIYGTDHPYGAIPTEAAVKTLTPDILKQWHASHFLANDAVIAVVGDVSKKEILPILEKYFGDLKTGEIPPVSFTPVEQTPNLPIYLIDRPGSVQSNIRLVRLGLRRNDPRYDAAAFLASIYAGNGNIGFMNRLFQNIREKHGYTYTPGGSLTASQDRGVLVAVAEVRNAVTDSALDQMLNEYNRLATEPISEADLKLAKSTVTGDYLMSLSDPATTSARALTIMEYGLPKDYYATYASRINSLTSEDLQNVAKQVFPAKDLAVIVTGDAKQIKEKLARFGKIEMYNVDLESFSNILDSAGTTLDNVLQGYYSTIGKPAMEKITDRQVNGKVTFIAGTHTFNGTLKRVEASPNMLYEEVTFPMGTNKRWVNGTQAWQGQGNVAGEVTGDDLQHELLDATFNEELHLSDPAWKVTLLGKKALEEKTVYVLRVAKPNVPEEKWYIDSAKSLLVQRDIPGPDGLTSIKFSDYKPVEGVLYPYHIRFDSQQSVDFQISEIKHNLHPDSATFSYKKVSSKG